MDRAAPREAIQLPGHHLGKSLAQARLRIRRALWAALDDREAAYSATLVEVFKVPHAARLEALRARRAEIAKTARALSSDCASAAVRLHAAGLGAPDIAVLLGATHRDVLGWLAAD